MKKLHKKIYQSLRVWQDNHYCDYLTCSIGDIALKRGVPHHNQILFTSRLLDVEEFLNGSNTSFPYQNEISFKAYGKGHDQECCNSLFTNLIKSYSIKGYDTESILTCDKEMMLLDGNHRMGLNIYYKVEKIKIKVLRRRINIRKNGDWYYEKGIPSEIMNKIYERFEMIQQWLIESGMTFCAVLPSDQLAEDLSHMATLLTRSKMKEGGFFCQFSMEYPDYEVNDGILASKRAKEIERLLKSRCSTPTRVSLSYNCIQGKEMFDKYYIP